jgi:hypothetical protein
MSLPVGFPGDVNKSSFMVGSLFNVDRISFNNYIQGEYLVVINLPGRWLERDVDNVNFVNGSGDFIHPICWSTDHDFVSSWFTENPHDSINSLVATNATEQIVRGQRSAGLSLAISEVADEVFQRSLVGIWVSIQT